MPPGLAASLTVEVRPQTVFVGEPAQLVITSDVAYAEPERLPDVDGIEWLDGVSRSSQTTIINLQASQTYAAAYPFRATREGRLDLPAFKVRLKQAEATTKPLTVHAARRQFIVEGKDATRRTATLEELLFLRVRLLGDRREFYVGEEIPLEITAHTIAGLAVDFLYPGIQMAPDGADSVFRDLAGLNDYSRTFTPYEQGHETIGKETFRIHRCRAWLRPLSAGRIAGTVALETTISIPVQENRRRAQDPFFDSFFQPFPRHQQHAHELTAALPDATVRPLPKPPGGVDFLGLVGEWQVEVDAGQAAGRVGEPFTLRIKVAGQGTAETLAAPTLDLPGCRIFPPEITRGERGLGDTDTAEIRYAVIPLQAGPLPVNLRLATFAPVPGEYRETSWRQILSVAPGEASGAVVATNGDAPPATARPSRERADGLLYLKRQTGGGVHLPLWRNQLVPLVVLLLGGLAVLALAEARAWQARRLAQDPALRRRHAARRRRPRLLRRLRRAGPDEMPAVIRDDVLPFLQDHLGLPPGSGITEIAARVDDPDLATALRDADSGAYLPGTASPAEIRDVLLRTLARLGVAVLTGVTLLGLAPLRAEAAENPFAAYDEGRFAEAAETFAARLDPRRPDPGLLYNLGNCRYQQGDLANALVLFERARRLAPRDSDIRENLNHVRRRLMLPEVGRSGHPLDLAADLRDHLRPDEWLLLAAAAWAALGLVLAVRRRLASHAWQTAAALLCLLLVLSLAAAAAQRATTYHPAQAVVLERGAPVHVLPSPSSREAEARLYPGEPVRIVETREDGWQRIRGEAGEGWIQGHVVAPLWNP
jgi:tetratricopeptide (TPR) repeat protein